MNPFYEESVPEVNGFPIVRVLAVDNDPAYLMSLETMMRQYQFEVTTTNEPDMALKLLRQKKKIFDIILTDVVIGDIDSLMFLELLIMEGDIPVIIVTSCNDNKLIMDAIDRGAVDYFLKPIDMDDIRKLWQHVFRGSNFTSSVKNNMLNPNMANVQEDTIASLVGEGEVGYDGAVPKKIMKMTGDEGFSRAKVASYVQPDGSFDANQDNSTSHLQMRQPRSGVKRQASQTAGRERIYRSAFSAGGSSSFSNGIDYAKLFDESFNNLLRFQKDTPAIRELKKLVDSRQKLDKSQAEAAEHNRETLISSQLQGQSSENGQFSVPVQSFRGQSSTPLPMVGRRGQSSGNGQFSLSVQPIRGQSPTPLPMVGRRGQSSENGQFSLSAQPFRGQSSTYLPQVGGGQSSWQAPQSGLGHQYFPPMEMSSFPAGLYNENGPLPNYVGGQSSCYVPQYTDPYFPPNDMNSLYAELYNANPQSFQYQPVENWVGQYQESPNYQVNPNFQANPEIGNSFAGTNFQTNDYYQGTATQSYQQVHQFLSQPHMYEDESSIQYQPPSFDPRSIQ